MPRQCCLSASNTFKQEHSHIFSLNNYLACSFQNFLLQNRSFFFSLSLLAGPVYDFSMPFLFSSTRSGQTYLLHAHLHLLPYSLVLERNKINSFSKGHGFLFCKTSKAYSSRLVIRGRKSAFGSKSGNFHIHTKLNSLWKNTLSLFLSLPLSFFFVLH